MAQRKVHLARRALDALQVQQEKLTLTALIDGIVSSRVITLGESAVAGAPFMTISDLSNVWLTGYIAEVTLGHIYVGGPAEVTVDAYPDRVFEGHIKYISSEAEFTPRAVQTQEERANIVFKVKIAVENAEMILKPGMPADARIFPEG